MVTLREDRVHFLEPHPQHFEDSGRTRISFRDVWREIIQGRTMDSMDSNVWLLFRGVIGRILGFGMFPLGLWNQHEFHRSFAKCWDSLRIRNSLGSHPVPIYRTSPNPRGHSDLVQYHRPHSPATRWSRMFHYQVCGRLSLRTHLVDGTLLDILFVKCSYRKY